jgi:hypothetical protein
MKNTKNTAFYISLLKSFPPHRKGKKRRAYLRAKFLGNKKIFFEIFIQKILGNEYNTNDKLRRLEYVESLPKLFSNISPIKQGQKYIFIEKDFQVVVKEKKNKELYLLTLYPL